MVIPVENASGENERRSILDVAQMAGVSIATVSRVINANGYVSSKTEKRVREAIERCGYVPNMAARGMRTNRMPVIGFVVDNVKNEYFSDLATNLQRIFMAKGYFLLICTTDCVPEVEQASIRMLSAQRASGLIVISRDVASDSIPEDMPAVCIDCLTPRPCGSMLARVESDNLHGGYLATKELIDKGCREIVLFTGPENAYTSRQRAQGYFSALLEAGLPIDLRRVFHFTGYDYSNGEQLVSQLIESGISCDGIFAICDYVVQGSLDALARHGIRVPEEVRVVGFDDLYMAQCAGRKLTTIHQYSEQVAQATADILLSMISGRKPDACEVVIPTDLVQRGTT